MKRTYLLVSQPSHFICIAISYISRNLPRNFWPRTQHRFGARIYLFILQIFYILLYIMRKHAGELTSGRQGRKQTIVNKSYNV